MPSWFKSKKSRGFKSPTDDHASHVLGAGRDPTTTPHAPGREFIPQGYNTSQEKVARDLWSEAFASLARDDQEILRPSNGDGATGDKTSRLAAVEKVMELTESRYEEYCKHGWHTKKGDTTRETNIKIKAQEIMCAALQFDDIVKAGLKFDPSGYGTTVWGVLSGALKLVQNDKDRADAVFDSAAVLAVFLPRYAIIEDHYRDRKTKEQEAFEDQIKNVYASILKYAACVQGQLNLSLAGKTY